MHAHINDRALYDHLRGTRKLTDEQLSHLAACAECAELIKVVKNLKEYIDAAEAKKDKGGGQTA